MVRLMSHEGMRTLQFIGRLSSQIWRNIVFFTLVAIGVVYINERWNGIIAVDSTLVTILGSLVSFALTLKVNNANTTWTDSRAEWSKIIATSRQLATLVWHNARIIKKKQPVEAAEKSNDDDGSDDDDKPTASTQELKDLCMNLLRGFSIATQHALNGDNSLAREDEFLVKLNKSLPEDQPRILREGILNSASHLIFDESPSEIPRDILTALSACVATLTHSGSLPTSLSPTISTSLNTLQTSLSNLLRTSQAGHPTTGSDAPSTTMHIKLSIFAYLFFLPFQLYDSLRIVTVPITALVTFIYLGFMAVGADVGAPFKKGLVRMDVGGLVGDLEKQIGEIAQVPKGVAKAPPVPLPAAVPVPPPTPAPAPTGTKAAAPGKPPSATVKDKATTTSAPVPAPAPAQRVAGSAAPPPAGLTSAPSAAVVDAAAALQPKIEAIIAKATDEAASSGTLGPGKVVIPESLLVPAAGNLIDLTVDLEAQAPAPSKAKAKEESKNDMKGLDG